MARPGATLRDEARIARELRDLLRHPVYRGEALPRGNGRLVLVLPGLFANDLYLTPMHRWLRRIGYRPIRSTLLFNAGCPQRLSEQIEEHVRERRESFRRRDPIAIIGHSRGGILGWALAARLQEDVSHLILLGSPAHWVARLIGATPLDAARRAVPVQRASDRVRQLLDPDCTMPACGCPFPGDLQRPLHHATRIASIYTHEDPIVPPAFCPVPGAHNVEVSGTHSGLAYNIETYQVIAEVLGS